MHRVVPECLRVGLRGRGDIQEGLGGCLKKEDSGCLHVCLHYKRSPAGDMKSRTWKGPGRDSRGASLALGLAPSYNHVTCATALLSPSLVITPMHDSSTLHLYLLLSVTAVPRTGGGRGSRREGEGGTESTAHKAWCVISSQLATSLPPFLPFFPVTSSCLQALLPGPGNTSVRFQMYLRM